MRYKLDINGYVDNVYFGCYGNGCTEYTGKIPTGYSSLIEWSTNALTNAYYLDTNGNLILDADREAELLEKIEQEKIDNEPLYRKDLYGTSDVLDSQYQNREAKGNVLVLTNVKKINPKVKITNIECYDYSKIDIVTQGKNMLKNDAITETIEGVTFTRLINGAIKINGTATANIEYNLSGSSNNTTSLFALKKNTNYYLNIGGLDCELKYYDGTTSQVYIGGSGVINLSESKEVTQVLIKIPSGTTLNETIYPMLECGSSASAYEEYKHRILTIDFNELIEEGLFPSDDLFPSDNLFPKGTTIDYISIEDSKVYVSVDGTQKYLMKANVNLFDGYNIVYTMQDTYLEMTYCINKLEGYSTTVEMNSAIKKSVDEIELEVNATINGVEKDLNAQLELKVDTDNLVSEINASADQITLKGNRFVVEADNFKLDKYGNMTCKNAAAEGLNINGGNIELVSETTNARFKITDKDNASCNYSQSARGINWIGLNNGYIGMDNVLSNPAIILSNQNEGNTTTLSSLYIQSPTITQTSLVEQKKNFEKFEDALPILDEIDIYKYNLKFEEDGHKKHIGFVIGEDYNYSSEITAVNEDGEEIGVDNYSMTSLCLQAIKELNNKVKSLENKIKELESDNNGEN